MKVSVSVLKTNPTAGRLLSAMSKGIKATGDEPVVRDVNDSNLDGFQALVIYGFVTECQTVIEEAKKRHIPWVFFDLGYWTRDKFYKVTVNARHPDNYIMARSMPDDRFKVHGLTIQPNKESRDGPILLAGMSGKAAWSFGYEAESWEHTTIEELRRHTNREIIYRPKPSWAGARPIGGVGFDPRTPIDKLLPSAFAVVAHHSNVGCDALVAGIPVFTKYGAAKPLATARLDLIEQPLYFSVEDRYQWASNLAYCQWSVDEMTSGTCWKYLRESGLVF